MDIAVGQTSHREMVVSEEMVARYAEITGDYNPLHFDQDFAKSTRFGGLISQGGITTGLLHALVAMDMPGPGTVFMTQRWSFPRPVYIGDTIRAEATVLSIHERKPRAEIQFVVTNQDGLEVLNGEATVYQVEPVSGA
ncbi:MAG: Acyl dehydratase [Chloroflexi bacterium]|jgi:acyl dehydratase|nr:MAG: Acyl dehydratase [Chloroflexota bacterium]